jgi:hypothetical protein
MKDSVKTTREARRRKGITDKGDRHGGCLNEVQRDAVKSPRGKLNYLRLSTTPAFGCDQGWSHITKIRCHESQFRPNLPLSLFFFFSPNAG